MLSKEKSALYGFLGGINYIQNHVILAASTKIGMVHGNV